MSRTRLFLIVLVGIALVLLTCNSKYWISLLDFLAWLFFIVTGGIIFLWTVIADMRKFRKERRFAILVPTIVAAAFAGTLLVMESHISGNKITLDRNNIEEVIVSKKLEIVNEKNEFTTEKRLFQKDANGNSINNALYFKVTADDRKIKTGKRGIQVQDASSKREPANQLYGQIISSDKIN